MEVARAHVRSHGYQIDDGGGADWITPPNSRGGCEVRVWFDSLEVRVQRTWRLGAWQVTDVKIVPILN